MEAKKLAAGTTFPRIKVSTLDGPDLTLGYPDQGGKWQMIVVYRGEHCPACTRYLKQLETMKGEIESLGVDVVCVSADTAEQARAHLVELGVTFPVGYGLTIGHMKQLGLYISHPRSAEETDHPFAEPGLFIVNPENNLQVTDISNGPFARPALEGLLRGLKFICEPSNSYPIRGTYD
jgi:peroxiredoxin